MHLCDAMFVTLGCSVAKEHAIFKIKYNEDYSNKLIETSLIGKTTPFSRLNGDNGGLMATE